MNKEIKRLEWFIKNTPAKNPKKMMTADEAFVLFSERGVKPDFSKITNPLRFQQLEWAKKWQGRTLEMWESGILDGTVPYRTLLGGENPNEILPKEVIDFIKKEMFKGADKEIIERVYKEVLKYWTWWRKLLFKYSNS